MTQPLIDNFVTAFLAEQGRYVVLPDAESDFAWVASINNKVEIMINESGTRADCEQWIAKQAARKAFGVMADDTRVQDAIMYSLDCTVSLEGWNEVSRQRVAIKAALLSLAAEPETTSGDAG